MSSSKKDNEVLLPKVAEGRKADTYLLTNLSTEQVVKLVGDFKPDSTLSANVFVSAFGPLADSFISSLEIESEDLPTQLTNLGQAWDKFCAEQIHTHYEKLLEQDTSHEILHYSLFAKRRVAELIRIKSKKIFNQLICVRPFAFYTVSNLWDPNTEKTNFVRNYFEILVESYLDFYQGKINSENYLAFINVIKSPYRHVYEISNEFESDYGSAGFRSIYIKELLSARTGVVLKIRNEQLEGFEQGDFYMPPPFTLEALSSLTLNWLAEQSFNFKNDLPANLLEFVLESSVETYRLLVSDLGKKLVGDFIKGVEVDLDPEFPEFNQGFLCYREIANLHQDKVQHDLFDSDLHCKLLQKTYELIEEDKNNKSLDSKRLKKTIAQLQGRRIYRPWEIISINKEIRALQRTLYQLELEQKAIERKTQVVKDITSEVYSNRTKPELPLIMKLADQICQTWKSDNEYLYKELGDPLVYADVFIFNDKNKKINQISVDLREIGYLESKLKYLEDKELVDYLHIWSEIHQGKSIKSLRQQFNDLRVNRILIEYERKVNKKSLSEIKEKHPRYSKIIDLIVGRESLEEVFEFHSKALVYCSKKLFLNYLKCDSKSVKDDLDKIQIYAECVAIIWDWISAEIRNPYIENTENHQKFIPWFEKEICRHVKQSDYKTYLALNYKRPSSVLGIEPGADFNWRDDEVFKSYITTITNHYLELVEKFGQSEALRIFVRYKDGMSSPFAAYLNPRRYDLDYASDKILLLDYSQKNLFSSHYRKEALEAWVRFHENAFFGPHEFSGMFFELVMRELKMNHPKQHLAICLALVDLEREQVKKDIYQYASGEVDLTDEQALEFLYINTNKADFLEGLKLSLS